MSAIVSTPAPPLWRRGVLAAVGLFAVAIVAAHVLRPDLDPAWVPVSEYALGPNGWPMPLAFLALSAGCAALFVAWRRRLTGWQGVVAQIGLALAAAGFLLAVVFPGDSILDTPQQTTTAGMIHGLGAVLVDGLPLASVFAAWSVARSGDRARRLGFWLAAALAWSGFIAVIVAMALYLPAAGQLGPDAPIGWANRYMMAAYALWLAWAASLSAERVRA